MRKTKIVCTIGPASDSREVLSRMLDAGMNVARLNFSHGSREDHAAKIALIREIAAEKNLPIAILQDLAGPKIRTGSFACAFTNASAACESRLAPNAVEQKSSGSAGG